MTLDQEQIVIDACMSNVRTYLPCETGIPIDYDCLCEQYIWHITCYNNHASSSSSQPGRTRAEEYMQHICQSAGSLGTTIATRKHPQQRRQINSILHSVGGVVASFLSSQSVEITVPTAIPNLPIAPPAQTTSQRSAVISSASSTKPTPTAISSTASQTTTTTNTSQSTSSSTTAATSSSPSSTPSPGLIAGAVIGGIAVLLLIGILIMLILRHKRKKQTPPTTPHLSTLESASHRSLDETLLHRTPMTEPRTPVAGYTRNEKEIYRSSQQDVVSPQPSEMATSANVWELDGRERERRVPSELESPTVERGSAWEGRKERGRQEHSELHF